MMHCWLTCLLCIPFACYGAQAPDLTPNPGMQLLPYQLQHVNANHFPTPFIHIVGSHEKASITPLSIMSHLIGVQAKLISEMTTLRQQVNSSASDQRLDILECNKTLFDHTIQHHTDIRNLYNKLHQASITIEMLELEKNELMSLLRNAYAVITKQAGSLNSH